LTNVILSGSHANSRNFFQHTSFIGLSA